MLPRFKIESSYKLRSVLEDLGITELFGSSADMSGISDSASIYVEEIVQKAFIEVNEEGTEATAATAASTRSGGFNSFIADRPFLFYITDDTTGIHLFSGRVSNPEQSQ